ncbi:MAG: ubiquitin-like small modifier protein 1 [Nitrososphaerota archaeon]
MQVKIYLPTPLRQYADGRDIVEVEARTVGEALQNLASKFTGLRKQIFTETGGVRSFVNVFVNDEDIRHLQGQETVLKEGDTIYIIPSIAGGCYD